MLNYQFRKLVLLDFRGIGRLYRQYRNMVSDQVVSLLSVPTKAGVSFAVPSIAGLSRNSLAEASPVPPVLLSIICRQWGHRLHELCVYMLTTWTSSFQSATGAAVSTPPELGSF